MTDRELLELAAKSAGLCIESWSLNLERAWVYPEGAVPNKDREYGGCKLWNPLTDDGDALRLAVKLNLDIRFVCEPDGAAVHCFGTYDEFPDCELPRGLLGEFSRSLKVTRRAIVRAAAEIGKSI